MIAQFSLRLICGMSLMWVLMPRSQVTAGFFRIQMLVVLGLSMLAALTVETPGATADQAASISGMLSYPVAATLCGTLAACAFVGSVLWTLERRRAGTVFVYLIAAVSTILLPSVCLNAPAIGLNDAEYGTAAGFLHLLSEWASAAVLGAAMVGMLLGHWYLTSPTMSIAPLSRLNLYLGVAASLRLVLSAVGLWLLFDQYLPHIYDHQLAPTHEIWLMLRWLAGILGPLCVVVMVWRILKYRNTQAATGVLFVAVILTFIGEMSASLLYHELRLPL